MNKIILLIISLLISLSLVNNSNANNLEQKLYKSVVITKIQIEKDYGSKVNKKIESIFIKYRYNKNRNTLNKLEVLLKNKIKVLNNKTILSSKEKKTLNLYNNLYYRTSLLLNYNL